MSLAEYQRQLERRRPELIALTQELVRFPTLNPPGLHYLDICEHVAARLEPQGFVCELLRAVGTPGDSEAHPRWNLVARRSGGRPGPCVHFNGHSDVVEVGSGWTRDPFAGELDGSRIYGRGTCDMKGGIACAIVAAEAFIATWPDHAGSIEVSLTADEETGGYGGVAWLAEQGYFSPERVQHVIIPEPLNKERICLGHRGVWWAELETFGRIGHGSMPFLGDCAIRHMGAVIGEMERTLFPKLAERRTDMPVVPEQARVSTLNINSLHGGQAEPPEGFDGWPSAMVADSCRMVIDRRFLAEESLQDVKDEFRETVEAVQRAGRDFNYEIRDMHDVLPSMTERDSPLVRALSRGIEARMGLAPEYVCSPGTYDQKHIDRIGRLRDCVAYGPGILDLAHQPDEYVDVDDMMDAAHVMGSALVDLLGVAMEEAV